jgi:uncharacterized protein
VDRIFLDANVLFSAAYRPNAGLARLWQLENVELMTSAYAAEEARLNLAEEDQRIRLEGLLEKVRIVTAVAPLPRGVKLAEKDQAILQAALQARATHLLTGDRKHFGPHFGRRLGGVLVLPPSGYLERRRTGGGL